jgi:hypothetical protein
MVTRTGTAYTDALYVLNPTNQDGTAYFIADSTGLTVNGTAITSAKTDYQQPVGLENIIAISAGTWTITRIAEGDYVYRHTAADDTSIIGININPVIRIAAAKGFKLDSIDVIYSIGTLALDAHTATLDLITYANNTAVAVTSVPLTGTLATATQANPYVTNLAVTTPAYDVTADTKYVFELTVNAAATSAYDFYGLMLRFTRNDL